MINASLKQLSSQLAARKISSVELTQQYLDRINSLNPDLNAYITLNAEASLSRMESMNSLLALLRKLKPIEFVSTVTTIHVHGVHRSASIFDYNLSTITKSIWWGFRFFNSNAICRTAQPEPSCVARNRKFQNRKFLIIRRETRDFLPQIKKSWG